MHHHDPDVETAPLDPIALSLALWLGLMVTVLGLQRLSERASVHPAPDAAAQLTVPPPYVAWGG